MKAISLWQPHATWVAMKWKTIETRTHDRFRSLRGQRIIIHAAQKAEDYRLLGEYLPPMDLVEQQNYTDRVGLQRGRLLCTAKVVIARWAPNIYFDLQEEWNKQGMCEVAGKYLLFLDDIQPLRDMIPFRGRQGIFNVPDELIK